MKKKTVKIVAVIVISIVLCLFARFVIKKDNINEDIKEGLSIEFDKIAIEERTVKIIDQELYIGNNEKELQNGFYDIKITIQSKDKYRIYLNKLWYKEYEEDYIQEDYLAKVTRQIVHAISNSKANKEELEYTMYKYVKDNYSSKENYEIIQDDSISIEGGRENEMFFIDLTLK